MKRVLSGIQPSGNIHLGNYLGAVRPHIELQDTHKCVYFIADLHALTTVRDPKLLKEYTRNLVLDYLAAGLDPEKTIFFCQSDVPEHSELTWIFSSVCHMGLLERAHAWKDAKAKKLKDPTVALFTYPILMASDILLYDPDIVPVGKDQKQHIEIARDIATKFNSHFGNTFTLPEPEIKEDTGYLLGTDGEHKMSKSYGNVIEPFTTEKKFRKQIMGIVTDSKDVDEPKDAENSTIVHFYQHFSTPEELQEFKNKFAAGGMGYGDAKKQLFEKMMDYFGPIRDKRVELENNMDYIDKVIKNGGEKAREIASEKLKEVKTKIGLL